jgi:hypothetical protein
MQCNEVSFSYRIAKYKEEKERTAEGRKWVHDPRKY